MHKYVNQHDYDWIYELSNELEPRAKIYLSEYFHQNIEEVFDLIGDVKNLTKEHEFMEVERICREVLKQHPLVHPFFYYLVDSYIKRNRLDYALRLVTHRMNQYIENPFRIVNRLQIESGLPSVRHIDKTYGWTYNIEMGEWIGQMRTLQNMKKDIEDRIARGYVYRPPKKEAR